MTRNYFILAIITLLSISILGCATITLVDYKTNTVDEEEVKTTLLNYYEARREKDFEGMLSFFHEDAKIMTGRYRMILSKQQYSEMLPSMIGALDEPTVKSPKINVNGDQATVTATIDFDVVILRSTYDFVREDGRWYIMNYKYWF